MYQTEPLAVKLVPLDSSVLSLHQHARADLHRAPMLYVCLVATEDSATYKQTTRQAILDWLQQVTAIPDATWLIVHFTTQKKVCATKRRKTTEKRKMKKTLRRKKNE